MALVLTLGAAVFAYVSLITHRIDTRIDQLHSQRATRFFALPPPFRLGQTFSLTELRRFLEDQGYVEGRNADEIGVDQYTWDRSGGALSLVIFRSAFAGAGHQLEQMKARFSLESAAEPAGPAAYGIRDIVRLDDNQHVDHFDNVPRRVGSFLAGRLRTQNSVSLSDIPVTVRLAVMAIEDVNFLEHSGVSVRSTVRALLRDLRAGRFVEGGSTITQQLMKNIFFSREKAISRKLKEAMFAMVTEARHSKEDILEAYLNEVYLGQAGTHEIHGVAEGARYYFHRPVSELSLTQSATLAAIIQAPNAQDPRRYPQRTLNRRNLVLKKMLDASFIEKSEYDQAVRSGLGVIPAEMSQEDVDYFMDLVMDRLPPDVMKRLDNEALTVYVTIQPYLQGAASRALRANIDRLEKSSHSIREKKKKGVLLQSALIAIDVKNCGVIALQGGRSYRQTQFNRVLQGHRQPGSLFKPFVYLTALEKSTPQAPFTPLTMIDDAPFEWKFGNQLWQPHNYDNQFRGMVSAQRALENSLNVPTAKVAQMVGVDAIVDTLRKAGIQSALPAFPSISLGSADVSPFELATAYTTLANLGKTCSPRPYLEIYDENKNLIQENTLAFQESLPPAPTFQTVNMLKGVFTYGTARAAQASNLPLHEFAGKSGTTNEFKDAWFVGFSPWLLVLVWVGYDEEAKVGLSGSSAALPLWVDYLKSIRSFVPQEDFVPPEGLVPLEIDPDSNMIATPNCPHKQMEYFVKGTEPTAVCTVHP